MRATRIRLPDKGSFFQQHLQNQSKESDVAVEKAQEYLNKHDEIQEQVLQKLKAHFRSLIPSDSKYDEHRAFLERKHKKRYPKEDETVFEDSLLDIFINKYVYLFNTKSYENFREEGLGKMPGWYTSISFGYVEGRFEKCREVHKMLSEINAFFKGNGEFFYYSDVNNTYVEISFRLL